MNRYILAFIVLYTWFALGTVHAQQVVTVKPAFPKRGQKVTITYHTGAKGAKISTHADKVELFFTYSTLYELPRSLVLKKSGENWYTSFVLPRYFTYATFYFKDGDLIDKPSKNKNYTLAAYKKNKQRVRNGYLHEAYSLPAQMGGSDSLRIRQEYLCREELKFYPDNYEAKLRLLKYEIDQASGDRKKVLIAEGNKLIAQKFYAAPTVMDNLNKVTMGYLILGERSRLDSIRHVVMQQYPHSGAAKEFLTSVVEKETDTLQKIALLKKALKDEKDSKDPEAYSGIHQTLFNFYTSHQEATKALYHARKMAAIKNPYRPRTLKYIASQLTINQLAPDSALKYADEALQVADSFPLGIIRYFPEFGYIPSYVNDSVRLKAVKKIKGNLTSLKGVIYANKGNAITAHKYASAAGRLSDDDQTLEHIAKVYTITNDPKKAMAAYRRILINSPSDTAAFFLLKKNYVQYHGTEKGLDTIMRGINNAWEKKMIPVLNSKRLDKKLPRISGLLDMKGNPVHLNDLKGKVIVMDFWATWCIPCMHEMPYLQKVYNQFREDTGVVFMITNSGANNSLEDAQKWVKRMEYSFPVYYTNDPNIGKKLSFNVIPALFVIDQAGNIQFKTIGFEGPKVAPELSLKVRILLNKTMNN